jgi:hypothetical protein
MASQWRVFSNEATYLTRSILSDPSARSIGFGWDNPLETPVWETANNKRPEFVFPAEGSVL